MIVYLLSTLIEVTAVPERTPVAAWFIRIFKGSSWEGISRKEIPPERRNTRRKKDPVSS